MTTIVLYHFSKRKNSTKRPTGQGTEVPCLLKSATTFQSPTFIVQKPMNEMLQYNYCKWADRYYFICSTTSVNAGQTEIVCDEDVLGTFKNEIGSYTCFIERSVNQDTLINDPLYVPTNEWQSGYQIAERPSNVLYSSFNANYIMRCVSGDGVSVYYLSGDTLKDVLSFMYDEGNFPDMLNDAFTKFLYDPAKYILDIKWVPFRESVFKGTVQEIKLGWFATGAEALLIGTEANSPTVTFSYTFEVNNPLYDNNDFRFFNTAFSRYNAQLPFLGVVPIDITKIIDEKFTVSYIFDAFSGIADVYAVSGHNSFLHFQAQLSVDVNISGISPNTLGTINSGVSAIANAVSGNIGGTLSAGFQTAQNALQPELSMIGNVGNVGGILNNEEGYIQCFACTSLVPNVPTDGGMDCNTRQISTCSGYLKCRNASVQIAGFTGDQETINNYLNSGFYYE